MSREKQFPEHFFKYGWRGKNLLLNEHTEVTLSRVPLYYGEINLILKGVYKRMVRFQKLKRNLFLTLHGQNVHRQQRQPSKFLKRYQPFASHA